MKPVAVLGVTALLLGGCAIHRPGAEAGHYLGYVRVETTATERPVQNTRLLVLGLWADPPSTAGPAALGLGLRQLRRLVVPADCRLVVSVATDAQLARVEQLIAQAAAQEGTCAVKS